MGRGVIGDRSDNGQSPAIANPSAAPSVSRFPYRYPRLHGLFLELCSFRHRIQLVCIRGIASTRQRR
jgi:hypothetical protein